MAIKNYLKKKKKSYFEEILRKKSCLIGVDALQSISSFVRKEIWAPL